MKLFEKALDNIRHDVLLLAPEPAVVPRHFRRIAGDRPRHSRLLREVQKLRGSIYLDDGAVSASQLTQDGRHVQPADYDSWHLLAMGGNGEVRGCARYRHHGAGVRFHDLGIRNSAIAQCPWLGPLLRTSVEAEIAEARRRGCGFSEVGGWAIAAEKRFTIEALRIALATFGLAQALGGCLGLTTATVRHRSSTILRRIGGRSLATAGGGLPPYFDPQYGCDMEVLRFDSSAPDPAYRSCVELLRQLMLAVPVVTPAFATNSLLPASRQDVAWLGPLPWPVVQQCS